MNFFDFKKKNQTIDTMYYLKCINVNDKYLKIFSIPLSLFLYTYSISINMIFFLLEIINQHPFYFACRMLPISLKPNLTSGYKLKTSLYFSFIPLRYLDFFDFGQIGQCLNILLRRYLILDILEDRHI